MIPLCGFVLLPLLALGCTVLIGSRGMPPETRHSGMPHSSWAVLPGMGATLIPRWTLGNFDPRLEGTARGEQFPVPAGVSCSPDQSTTLTSFQKSSPREPLPRLCRGSEAGERQ